MRVFYSEDSQTEGFSKHASSEILEQAINYTFKDKNLLKEALTHRSYYHENPNKARQFNERIEFLGDAVLGLVIAHALYSERGCYDESRMSKIKSFLVSGETLSQIAEGMGIAASMRLGKGEEQSGGRKKISILANALEALIGAVFLDGGYKDASKVVMSFFDEIFKKVLADQVYYDFKSELQELSQVRYAKLPEYRLTEESGDDHDKTFTYAVYLNGIQYGSGTGKNKKTAQINAARCALENPLLGVVSVCK
ncbi:MAG: ribonuclease III [Nitrospirae bacterium]|nr:ribonuclease III [Nitrospirota bacterium]MBF0540062.1 ribonuclease III [Nitrospirota bacterium]